jgi:EAL domain-containing protein (putative c-di-GMP-specific phosphodiesterase class I)
MAHPRLSDQIEHLSNLIEVYGDVLIAWELREPPDRVVSVIAESGRLDTSEVQTLLEEILIGGGARLFTEFHRIEAAAREAGDAGVQLGVERVREALLHIGRYNADALAWGMGTTMYRSQASSLGALSDPKAREEALKTLELKNAIRRGLERKEFRPAFEPIVLLQNSTTVGFETLARWTTADGQVVSPQEFIPVAEESGLILALGNWILRQAWQELQQWSDAYPHAGSYWISVNLSRRQLADPGLGYQVSRLLEETGGVPSRLMLEITESTIMQNVEEAAKRLATIKAMGVRVALDDFGTGYSSLSLLHQMPIDVVKIDRSFVQGMKVASDGSKILQAITSLTHNLGLEVVAEGIERADQMSLLKELGCKYGQGHYFAQPLEAADVVIFLAASAHSGSRGEIVTNP